MPASFPYNTAVPFPTTTNEFSAKSTSLPSPEAVPVQGASLGHQEVSPAFVAPVALPAVENGTANGILHPAEVYSVP